MNRFLTILALLLIGGGLHAQESAYEIPDLFDSALTQRGLTRQDVRFDQDEMATWGGSQWKLSAFSLFHRHPFRLPSHAEVMLEDLIQRASKPIDLVSLASRLIDHPIQRGLVGDPLEAYTAFPDTVPKPSITRDKNVLTGERYAALKDGIDLVYALADDEDHLFRRGLEEVDNNKYRERLFDYFVNENDERLDELYEILEKVDMNRMLAGAQDYAEAAGRLADSLHLMTFPDGKTEIKTRRGLIVVGTAGDDEFEYYDPPLLIVDGGGDDVYRLAGYPNDHPVAIIVDAAGDDRYLSADSTRPGLAGAILGVSILIDRSGNDRYEAQAAAQGAGVFGVGLLMDGVGDDVYTAENMSQGMGAFGIGILADSAGSDSLYCLSTSQGFGYTRGCGLVVNVEGDDRYVAEDDSLFNPSSQTKEHNSSSAQGVGFGKRSDYLDGHSWAGGVGILCDGAGDDRYSAGLFAQGCAYWYALGMLLDGGGNDRYNGVWYVQGSGAHFAVGYLDDFDGDDTYTATHNMAIGAGHDFSLGYLNERAGNDTYHAPNLSLGGGNANGIGIFHDYTGNDAYNSSGGTTLGRTTSSDKGRRRLLRVFGLFADGGGVDHYMEPYAKNGSRWTGPSLKEDDSSITGIGVGIDR